jgi:hypothetical protein
MGEGTPQSLKSVPIERRGRAATAVGKRRRPAPAHAPRITGHAVCVRLTMVVAPTGGKVGRQLTARRILFLFFCFATVCFIPPNVGAYPHSPA